MCRRSRRLISQWFEKIRVTRARARVSYVYSERSERGYRSRMAVTLGQGLGQLDSTYSVIVKSTRKKPTKNLYAANITYILIVISIEFINKFWHFMRMISYKQQLQWIYRIPSLSIKWDVFHFCKMFFFPIIAWKLSISSLKSNKLIHNKTFYTYICVC